MATPLPPRTSKNDALIMATPYEQLTQRQKDYADMYGLTLQAPAAPIAATVPDVTSTSGPGRLHPIGNPAPAIPTGPVANSGPVPMPTVLPGSAPTTPITDAAGQAQQQASVDYNSLATNDPEYLLALQRLKANLSNARAHGNTSKVNLKTQLQDLLRQYDRSQKADVKGHLEGAANRGMLYSGGQVEGFGNINTDYADRRTRSQNDELNAELGVDQQVSELEQNNVFDQQQALFDTINRLKGNAGNYAPVTPGGASINTDPIGTPTPVATPAPAGTPVAAPTLPSNAGQVVNPMGNTPLPTRNSVTDKSITSIPESKWTARQRAYADMYGLRGLPG